MISIIILSCWLLTACCDAVMDTLTHHYYASIFNAYNSQYWNPAISWKNKYKNGKKTNGPAFFLSTGLLIAFTDAWHLFKSIKIILTAIVVVAFAHIQAICFFSSPIFNMFTWLLILGYTWNITFSIFYNYLLKKN